MSELRELETAIASAMHADQFSLRKLLRTMQQSEKSGKPFDRTLISFRKKLEKSVQLCDQRRAGLPTLKWDDQLPVVERRQEIADAIRQHQVVIICGETGSGKSTQLPKIALEIGRGIHGVIGHTQPRRIAARSIAARVAEELSCPLGRQVGFRIRFQDTAGPDTLVRLMTDGIMLAETQTDRFLDQYDTIIIDEAHERSLNIDFLMGYLKRLLPKRRDLRLIITSATIDAERFAAHFGTDREPAPVIMVTGRTYPVEIRYRPLDADPAAEFDPRAAVADDAEPRDWMDGIIDAIEELAEIDSGHILVFLPTERDIRDVDRKLSGRRFKGDTSQHPTQIVPLYGRLSTSDQDRVFRPWSHRRIVLATNVAESSLTVPGIRYVVDTGTARISRYSARSRMQRLPIEAVSQASANQRAGRCGRVGPGICIRLYSPQDFSSREAFTAPEIQRTNLAAVILRTLHLQLGDISDFPFLDPPRPTTIREGFRTLEELGAITADGSMTQIGRRMARMPVDPRISRIILAAVDEQCIPEILVIAAALETQDPRERPIEKQQQADEAHAQFKHKDSDFLTLLNLWDTWHDRSQKLSGGQLRKWCQQNFLSWLRMREWIDVHRQLRDLLADSDDDAVRKSAGTHPVNDRRNDFAAIHRSLMTGLLANIAFQTPEGEYSGAGGNKLTIWPGSALSNKGPKWFVASELVETSKRFARTIARIQPEWIEPLAGHLVTREYSEPHWDAQAGNVMAFEKVTLWGMPIVPRRRIAYGRINPEKSRELLILHGLVELGLLFGDTVDDRDSEYAEEEEMLRRGTVSRVTPGRSKSGSDDRQSAGRRKGWGREFPFLEHNHRILQQIEELQHRTRRHDLMPSDEILFEFYSTQIPADVVDRDLLRRWYQRSVTRDKTLLQFDINQFADQSERSAHAVAFPESAQFGMMHLPLSYQLDPGRDADGVTVTLPVEGLGQLSEARLSWLVPGLLEQKILALIRSLPKDLRRHFVPAPDTAKLVASELTFGKGDLHSATAQKLSQLCGEPFDAREFDTSTLPDHLRFNIRVIRNEGDVVTEGRDLQALRLALITKHEQAATVAGPSPEEQQWHRTGFTAWDFADIPESIMIERAGMKLESFPALRDDQESVALTLCQTPAEARQLLRLGIRRLILLTERKRLKTQVDHLPQIGQIRLLAAAIKGMDVNLQLMLLSADRAYLSEATLPRSRHSFEKCVQQGRNRLSVVAQEFVQFMPALFQNYHETRRAVEQARGPGWEPLLQDMKSQLASLIHPAFLMDTPWPWLIQFPRYLTAIRQRLQRLASGGLKTETSLLQEFVPWHRRYEERLKQHQSQHRSDPMLEHYRWMLEEYRVSLFAQKLGTAIAVSTKKLEEQWQRVT
jgi:ATP-dependent helicase HrpA